MHIGSEQLRVCMCSYCVPAILTLVGMQYDVGLYLALVVSAGFVCIRPSPQLHPVKPAGRLISLTVLGPLALLMAFFVVQQGIAIAYLKQQSWYHSNNSQVCVQQTGIRLVASHSMTM